MNQPTAKYKISDTFKITGRGLVLAGTILEGTIYSGDLIEFTALDKTRLRKITGVESVTKSKPDPVNVGLIIKCIDENEINELRNWRPDNTIGLVYKSDT